MSGDLTLIGYGEAGRTFANAAGWANHVRVFDIKSNMPNTREQLLADYAADGVLGVDSAKEATQDSPVIISLVTADQAAWAAQTAASYIAPDSLYFDMNSIAPDTKRAAAKHIAAAKGRYVDVAVMAPVEPARLDVPLLLSGAHAPDGAVMLSSLGFNNIRVVSGDVGRASSIKMIRSIMVKGQEALTAEMMLAARQAGVADEVLHSLGKGWDAKSAYNLERMRTHGNRRAAEMEEAAKTLEALGVEPMMTKATIRWQKEMAQSESKT